MQRKADGTAAPGKPGPIADAKRRGQERAAASAQEVPARGSGRPLPESIRESMELAFGQDFAPVRVHESSAATDIGARAYTHGEDIVFAPGQLDTESEQGRSLIGHELTHVVHQRAGLAGRAQGAGGLIDADLGLEAEADELGARAARGEPVHVAGAFASVGTQRKAIQREGGDSQTETAPGDDDQAADGPGYEILGGGSFIRIRRDWYEANYKDGVVINPAINRQIIDDLATNGMPWIGELSEQAKSEAASELELKADFREGAETTVEPIRRTVYMVLGLPPGVNFQWDFPVATGATPAEGDPPARFAVCTVRTSELIEGSREGRQVSPELARQILEQLEADTGQRMDGAIKGALIRDGRISNVFVSGPRGSTFEYWRGDLVNLFGDEEWKSVEQRLAEPGASPIGETGGGTTFDENLDAEDRAYAEQFMREISGDGGGGEGAAETIYVGITLVAVMREIDAHPSRDRIIAMLRGDGATQTDTESPYVDAVTRFRNAMHAVNLDDEYQRLGISDSEPADIDRPFRFPVEGQIVNHGDLLFTGKEAAFSFRTTSRNDHFGIPWVEIVWVVTRAAGPGECGARVDRGWTRHRDYAHEAPDRYEITFDEPGVYEINALVDHRFYLPNTFTIYVEVTREEERLRELEQRTYGAGMFADGEVTDSSYEFPDTSWSDTEGMSTGRVLEGDIDSFMEPGKPTPPGTLDRFREQKARIQSYLESGNVDPRNLEWATEYLRRMEETESEISEEREGGAIALHIQGVYLARESNATSQELTLVAHARKDDDEWEVIIHDTTQAFDAENSRYNETDSTFRGALEACFVEMCKSYPTGTMTIRAEKLDEDGLFTGRWIGFELDCNSTWEIIKSTVWDPAVQVAVNITGAVTAIFLPATAPVIIPLLLAYNGGGNVDQMVDYYERDNLTFERAAIGIGSIAIDVLPFVGTAGRLVKVGGRAYHIMHGLEIAGDLVLINATALEEIERVRMGKVREAAELHAQIERLEHDNASDPSLPALRDALARSEEEARDAWATTYAQIAVNQAMIRVPSTAARHLHQIHTHRREAGVRALDAEVARGAGRPMADVDTGVVSAGMGVPVSLVDGSDVKIKFEVGRHGGLTDLRLEVGRDARLETVNMHRETLAEMRRYEGVAGALKNVLGRVEAYVRGRGRPLSPRDGRAFEAHFELKKLPRMVEEFRNQLTSQSLDSGTRARLEREVASLEAQIKEHAKHLDDLAPGLGYVASRGGDDEGRVSRMGDDPAEATVRADELEAPRPDWDNDALPEAMRESLRSMRDELTTENGRALFDSYVAEHGAAALGHLETVRGAGDDFDAALTRHAETLDRLIDAGMTAEQVAALSSTHGPRGVEATDALLAAGVQPRHAHEILSTAHDIGVAPEVADMIRSGNLENLPGLRRFMNEVASELRQGLTGKFTQLMEAARRAKAGNRVAIEGRRHVDGDAESGQADVIDFTAREAIQMKVVTSADSDAVVSNLQRAIEQVGGIRGEVPPAGHKRIAQVLIYGPDNPLITASRRQLLNELKGKLDHLPGLSPEGAEPGEVHIQNTRGSFVFTPDELE